MKEKILINITNLPHVLFFEPIINKLKERYEIIITTRDLAQTIPLLEKKCFKYTIIGGHYKNKFLKAIELITRSFLLYIFIRKEKPDLCISHGSYFCSIAARFAGVKEIWTLDGDKAKTILFISMKFAQNIVIPECVLDNIFIKYGAKKEKLYHYPGLKDEFYLYNFKKDPNYLKKFKVDSNKKTIFLRPEANFAIYYHGKKNVFLDLIPQLLKKYNVILMPRTEEQKKLYSQFIKGVCFVTLLVFKA